MPKLTEMTSHYIKITPVVEFVRKDAEVAVCFDYMGENSKATQVVIRRKCASIEEAQHCAEFVVKQLLQKVESHVTEFLKPFPPAKP